MSFYVPTNELACVVGEFIFCRSYSNILRHFRYLLYYCQTLSIIHDQYLIVNDYENSIEIVPIGLHVKVMGFFWVPLTGTVDRVGLVIQAPSNWLLLFR